MSLRYSADFRRSRLVHLIVFAISKCYGKVRVLFFRATTLVSAGKSHSSGARGLVVRCLLFNPEDSCSNRCMCANFFTSIWKQKSSPFHFFSALWDSLLFGFVGLPKVSPFFFDILQQWMLKNLKGSPCTVFSIVRFFKMFFFCLKMKFSQAQHAIFEFFF